MKPTPITVHEENADPELALQCAIEVMRQQVDELREHIQQDHILPDNVWVAPLTDDHHADTSDFDMPSNDRTP